MRRRRRGASPTARRPVSNVVGPVVAGAIAGEDQPARRGKRLTSGTRARCSWLQPLFHRPHVVGGELARCCRCCRASRGSSVPAGRAATPLDELHFARPVRCMHAWCNGITSAPAPGWYADACQLWPPSRLGQAEHPFADTRRSRMSWRYVRIARWSGRSTRRYPGGPSRAGRRTRRSAGPASRGCRPCRS